jgi:hypothetical protein
MPLPDSLQIALKEWAAVCSALETGRQMILLRKGGIFEAAGEFELENPRFLLFPTYLHQNLKMLKPEAHGGFEPRSAEPEQIRLSAAAEVADIVRLSSRAQMDAIEAEHIWTPPLIEMRFSYRPENPLYLLLLRVYRVGQPVTVANTPAYAGCKSWVPLEQAINAKGARAVIADQEFESRRARILNAVDAA